MVKHLHNFELPKEIRTLNDEFDDYMNELRQNFIKKELIEKLKIIDIKSELMEEIRNLINKKMWK